MGGEPQSTPVTLAEESSARNPRHLLDFFLRARKKSRPLVGFGGVGSSPFFWRATSQAFGAHFSFLTLFRAGNSLGARGPCLGRETHWELGGRGKRQRSSSLATTVCNSRMGTVQDSLVALIQNGFKQMEARLAQMDARIDDAIQKISSVAREGELDSGEADQAGDGPLAPTTLANIPSRQVRMKLPEFRDLTGLTEEDIHSLNVSSQSSGTTSRRSRAC